MQLLLGLFLLGIGVLLASIGISRFLSLNQVAAWPRARGVMLDSTIGIRRVQSRFSWDEYSPKVHFQYEIAGNRQYSRILSMDPNGFSYECKSDAEKIVKRFPAGSEIEVYVSPANNSVAALVAELDPRRKSHFAAISVAGLSVAILGVIGIYAF